MKASFGTQVLLCSLKILKRSVLPEKIGLSLGKSHQRYFLVKTVFQFRLHEVNPNSLNMCQARMATQSAHAVNAFEM